MVKITLDSKNITKFDLEEFADLLKEISMIDLLLLTKLCENEAGERIENIYELRMGTSELDRTEI